MKKINYLLIPLCLIISFFILTNLLSFTYAQIFEFNAEDYYETEIGKASHVVEGEEIGIITYGSGVHWAIEYAEQNQDISIDILDLRTLSPLDYDAIRNAVLRTGRILILHEDTLIGGIGGEISAWITENCFEYLDAPVMRCTSLDTPVPFSIELENEFLAKARLDKFVQRLLNY